MYIDISDVHALPTYDNNLYANLLLGDTITDPHPPPHPAPISNHYGADSHRIQDTMSLPEARPWCTI